MFIIILKVHKTKLTKELIRCIKILKVHIAKLMKELTQYIKILMKNQNQMKIILMEHLKHVIKILETNLIHLLTKLMKYRVFHNYLELRYVQIETKHFY